VLARPVAASNPPPTVARAPTSAPATIGASGGPTFAVFGAPTDPGGFNPLLLDSGGGTDVWLLLFDGLVAADPKTGAPTPALAESWSASPDGPIWARSA